MRLGRGSPHDDVAPEQDPREREWQEHVECVFEEVLAARGKLVRADAKIAVIGVAKGSLSAIRYFSMDCE